MTKVNNGINGPFSGKVGSVVGVNCRGVNYISAKPNKSQKGKPSVKQLAQRVRMSVVGLF